MVRSGQSIGRYKLLREIGRGGMGVVFEATHADLGNRVAIKIVEEHGASGTSTPRFVREARAAAQTRHLHAVSVFDIGVEDGLAFIVMELLDGETLADLIAREGPLSPTRVVELFLPVLSAVSAAHDAGIVHRDLKPSNIMLARRGGRIVHPVVTDFGISKLLTEDTTDGLTGSHAVLGTLHYMAPELTRAAKQATPLSDQYSVGVMLYEAATGQRPFAGAGPYELMHSIVTGAFEPPRSRNEELPEEFEKAILRAMRASPKERFESVRELATELLAFGSSRTWALWAPEFRGNIESEDSTLADTPNGSALSLRPVRRAVERRRWVARAQRGIFYAALVGLGFVISVLVQAGRPMRASAPASAGPTPMAALSADSERSGPLGSPAPLEPAPSASAAASVEPSPEPTTTPPTAPQKTSNSSGRKPIPRGETTGVARQQAAAKTAAKVSKGSAPAPAVQAASEPPPRRPEVGTNNVPIPE